MGYYSAAGDTMDAFRRSIDDESSIFLRAVSFYKKQGLFRLEGEMYKRILGDSKPEDIREWYQRRSFSPVHESGIDGLLFFPGPVDELIAGFDMLKPLYRYLWSISPAAKRPDSLR